MAALASYWFCVSRVTFQSLFEQIDICKSQVKSFFPIRRGIDKSIICRGARKYIFYALERMWVHLNSKGFEHEYGKCSQH